MAIAMALKTFLLSCAVFGLSNAYIIDEACGSRRTNIIAAVDEALGIAEYASWRIANDQSNVDPFRKQMLGDNQGISDLFVERMKTMGDVVGPQASKPFVNDKDRSEDSHILFRCDDGAAKESGHKPDRWYDRHFKNRFPLQRYYDETSTPKLALCGDGIVAMTVATEYSKKDPNEVMPHHIIYLCKPAFDTSIRPTTIGKGWKELMWTGRKIDHTAKFLSGTILHELLHAQSYDDLPGTLPSGITERYLYKDIVALTDDDKAANAHGYALLATASYMKAYEIGTNGKMGNEWTPDKQPGKSPNDRHPE